MKLFDELNELVETYNSPRIEEVKQQLKEAASSGLRILHIYQFDNPLIKWLDSEGLQTYVISDQRSGDILRIRWENKKLYNGKD